jgi:hypothetical protein
MLDSPCNTGATSPKIEPSRSTPKIAATRGVRCQDSSWNVSETFEGANRTPALPPMFNLNSRSLDSVRPDTVAVPNPNLMGKSVVADLWGSDISDGRTCLAMSGSSSTEL